MRQAYMEETSTPQVQVEQGRWVERGGERQVAELAKDKKRVKHPLLFIAKNPKRV